MAETDCPVFHYEATRQNDLDLPAQLTNYARYRGDFGIVAGYKVLSAQKKSAACWFIGKRFFDIGQKVKARDYFSLVAGDPSVSKYATFCWEYMGVE